MSKKNTVKKSLAVCLALASVLGTTGCNFIVTDNEADLLQTVATVNITKQLKEYDEFKAYADNVQSLIKKGWLSNEIPKRDLMAKYLSEGSSLVQSGYTYEETFNQLIDGLINQKLLTQYVVAYKLSTEKFTYDACKTYVESAINEADATLKKLYQSNPEYLTLKYFLTEGKEDAESLRSYNEAEYTLRYSINSTLDAAEQNYITLDDEAHTHETTRITPNNVNAQKSEYYPISGANIEYEIYTGCNDVEDCKEYEALEGSTKTTRKNAYNLFLSNLQSYNLIGKNEDTADITRLDYYYLQLSEMLANMLVYEYGEELKEQAIEKFTDSEVEAEYNRVLQGQQQTFETTGGAFNSALEGLSDTSFVLYGLENFGFVYNILLPFSASQNLAYTTVKNKFGDNQEAIYTARRELLAGIQATDLREAWFCADNEDEHYAYTVTDNYFGHTAQNTEEKYLFFENTKADKQEEYETLTQYYGKYPYNGNVTLEDGKYTFTPNKVDIDSFISIFEGYINYASGVEAVGSKNSVYTDESLYINTDTKKTNFEKFIYYSGKAQLGDVNPANYFYQGSETDTNASYLTLSAVNELMFAYSTDTGCLNTYMGYAVQADKTEFVSEFEYAAQKAVQGGVGSYVVVPSDYGWHIIYCSFVYEGGEVYGGYKAEEKDKEGTFSYLFYESMKTSAATGATTNMQNRVLNNYQQSAVRNVKAYQDLLDWDK